MELVWMLKNREISVNMTENSFKKVMNMLNECSDGTFMQINDPRFNDGNVICMRKSEILGWKCPELALIKYLETEE